jgi:2-iminobutanoate/2-iminopropanoate deaminase
MSGQIGIYPAPRNPPGNADMQTRQESGLGFEDVVQTRTYLTNMSDWTIVNGIYGTYFSRGCAARAALYVTGQPKDVLVEIEMVAQKRQES